MQPESDINDGREVIAVFNNGRLQLFTSGYCADCGYWNSARAGGLNEHGQCPACASRWPVSEVRDA